MTVGGVAFEAEVVRTADERTRGLSGRERIRPKTGMLFMLGAERVSSIWMKDMRFPLDIIWISAHCEVAGTARNVPPPTLGASDGDLPTYSSDVPVAYVLEVNAGEADAYGIDEGDSVRFSEGLPGVLPTCRQ